MLPLDHFTLGQVNFVMSFGPLNEDTRQLRCMNLEIGNAVTNWNLEYGIAAQVVFKTLDLNEAGKNLENMTGGWRALKTVEVGKKVA